MEKFAINKKLLRELSLMNNHNEPSEEIIDSLYAQMILEISIYQFQKSDLIKEIDKTLETGNKELFMKLASKYNEMLTKYKDGIKLSEQEYEFTIQVHD